MKLLRLILKALLLSLATVAAACVVLVIGLTLYYNQNDAGVTVRFRLTAEATDDSNRSLASAIYIVNVTRFRGPRERMMSKTEGDALFIEKNDGNAIVILLNHGTKALTEYMFAVMPFMSIWGASFDHYDRIERRNERLTGSGYVPISAIPTIVSLDASRSPGSTTRVWPPSDSHRGSIDPSAVPPVKLRIDVLHDRTAVSRTIDRFIPWVTNPDDVAKAAAAAGLSPSAARTVFRR